MISNPTLDVAIFTTRDLVLVVYISNLVLVVYISTVNNETLKLFGELMLNFYDNFYCYFISVMASKEIH